MQRVIQMSHNFVGFSPMANLLNDYGDQVQENIVEVLVSLDSDVFFHSLRTQKLSLAIANRLLLDERELEILSLGSLLHDIGKKYISQAILEKPGPLSPDEWFQIRQHPTIGFEIASEKIGLDRSVCEILLNHHRWANGEGGYPGKIREEVPSKLARIVTVADVYDAMTSDRPYRKRHLPEDCLRFLEGNTHKVFEDSVVRVLKEVVNEEKEAENELATAKLVASRNATGGF